MRSIATRTALAVTIVLVTAGVARAHVSITSGPAAASKSQKITFGVGHGCDGADTLRVRVEIPSGVSSVRAFTSDFGKPRIEGTAAAVTAVIWEKPVAEVQDADFGYYELTIRARVADVAFTKIYFRVRQTCRAMDGMETVVDWTALPGETGEAAPALTVLPARQVGWNRLTLPVAVAAADLPTYFADAQIVWRGTEAYSPNANTMAMIATTAGVSALAGDLAAAQELWVKY